MQSQTLKTDPLAIFEGLRDLLNGGRPIIVPEGIYPPEEAAEGIPLSKSALAQMRMEGEGPAYIKLKGKVLYRGQDLIDWLDSQRVEPRGKARTRRVETRAGRGNA